jgi:hypothetical protein
MDPKKGINVFLAEFDFQVDQISSIYKQLDTKLSSIDKKPVSKEMVESAGYWLHNLYCAYEDLFKMVSGFWENNLSSNGEYHINLLRRMILEIKGVRPRLLSMDSHSLLNELRGFRHVFRHAYNYGLDDEKVTHLLRKTVDNNQLISKDFSEFRSIIEKFDQTNQP